MKLFKGKKNKIQKFIIIILSIILFYYSLKTIYFLILKINKKTKFPKKFIEDKVKVETFNNKIWGKFYFYTTNKCGRCSQIKEEWTELLSNKDVKECSQTINGCRFNNKLIEFIVVNCDDEENSCVNIESYPTFVLEIIKDNKKIIYNKTFSMSNIKQWLEEQTK